MDASVPSAQELSPSPETEPKDQRVSLWATPPGWFFHVVVAVPALVLLWASSLPGDDFLSSLAAAGALLLIALVWLGRTIAFVASRPRRGSTRWLAVAPAMAVLVIALLATDVSLRARFATSQTAFEQVVETSVAPHDEPTLVQGFPRRLGSYQITNVTRRGAAVAFYEEHGAFFSQAGFAYLPDGPGSDDSDVFGSLTTFHHLTGPWYTFNVSD